MFSQKAYQSTAYPIKVQQPYIIRAKAHIKTVVIFLDIKERD